MTESPGGERIPVLAPPAGGAAQVFGRILNRQDAKDAKKDTRIVSFLASLASWRFNILPNTCAAPPAGGANTGIRSPPGDSVMVATALVRTITQLRQRVETPDDDELLRRFAHVRDEAAFAELVHRHGAMVQGVARRALGDHHAAEDILQATFL